MTDTGGIERPINLDDLGAQRRRITQRTEGDGPPPIGGNINGRRARLGNASANSNRRGNLRATTSSAKGSY